ncbi:MAG: substrate-binding domain-containing protein [Anaerolineae bacterium]|nr:substrate-binding domain-containing protein [Anaerolineae bacterium]
MHQNNKTGPTIGIFMDLFGGYQEAIWNGISEVARDRNANLLCFVGGALEDRLAFLRHWNVIYDLAGPINSDGLIILSSAMQNYVTIERFTQFCRSYAPLPVVSIAQRLEGIPSVTIDNSIGQRELMKHLLDHHHYRQIAFIRGPESNAEANTRYDTYVQMLEDHGIPFDPKLVVTGNFVVEDGGEAVKLLLDHNKADFEALVVSNDNMAIGAWQELNRRGINVPQDVAITGFDDIPKAAIFAVPLTTVRQSLVEQGRQATKMLLNWLQDGLSPENAIVETELVIRESCGCLPLATLSLPTPSQITPITLSNDALEQQRSVVLAEIREVISTSTVDILSQPIEPLIDSFFDVLQGRQGCSQFLSLFGQFLRQGSMAIIDAELEDDKMVKWQKALLILRENALPYRHPDVTEDIDGLLYQAYGLLIDAARRVRIRRESHVQASVLAQFSVVRELNTTSSSLQIADFLTQNLPTLGIGTATLALYEDEPVPPQQSRLIMACHNGQRLELEPGGQLFSSAQLIPPDILPRDQWPVLTIHPLLSRDIHLGFLTMEVVTGQWSMYNTYVVLAEQIGSALYRALLQQRNEQSNKQLEQHTISLTQANTQLAEANIQLEQFADIASHDLQEPLRMVASYLQLLEKRYGDKLDDDAKEFIGYAVEGAVRMKQMINDLLAYSRTTTTSRPLVSTDCEQLLTQALSELKVEIQTHDVLVTHDPLPIVMADSVQLVRVFRKLIDNAIKFCVDRQPRIHISARHQNNEWVFSVKDNGIGFEPEYAERIFVVFRRLHTRVEYPGSGVGLAICKKIIEQHGGRIWVKSRPGEGSTFFFTIPAQSLEIT